MRCRTTIERSPPNADVPNGQEIIRSYYSHFFITTISNCFEIRYWKESDSERQLVGVAIVDVALDWANAQGAALAALFVRRPVLAFVLNAIILVAGIAALMGMQVQELPNVSRPVLTINTDWSGASAETVDTGITAVIEGAAARVSGVTGLSSSSRYGSSRTTVASSYRSANSNR